MKNTDRYWLIIPPGRGKPRISCRSIVSLHLKAGEHAVRLVVQRPQATVIPGDLTVEVPDETPCVETEGEIVNLADIDVVPA